MDITQLILDDHHEQRRQFAMLEQIDPADTGTLSALWSRLAAFLELHAAAEEAINRCLRIIRRGGQQARAWRHRALQLAIIIDLADRSPSD